MLWYMCHAINEGCHRNTRAANKFTRVARLCYLLLFMQDICNVFIARYIFRALFARMMFARVMEFK